MKREWDVGILGKRRGIIGLTLGVGLIFCVFFLFVSQSFDETLFQVDRVYDHIEELAKPEYEGRQPGTEGNQRALEYVADYFKEIGVVPGGENGTYFQSFEAMVPYYSIEPFFYVLDQRGEVIQRYRIREDYRDSHQGRGFVEGELMYLNQHMIFYESEVLKDKIVLVDVLLRQEDVQYAKKSGVKAIVYTVYKDRWIVAEPVKMTKASGNIMRLDDEGIIIHGMEVPTFMQLKSYADRGCRSTIGYEYAFRKVKTANILGRIDGKNKDGGYIVFSAHIDHVGKEYDGRYFPGALDDASGMAMVMELARVIKEQKTPPNKTILFAGWNHEEGGIVGSNYYVNHPIYPLEKTQVIQLDCIGFRGMQELLFASGGRKGEILRSRFRQIGEISKLKVTENNFMASDHAPFVQKAVPAVLIMDNLWNIKEENPLHTYGDTTDVISKENLDKVGGVLLSYIQNEAYGQGFIQDFYPQERLLLSLLALVGICIYLVYRLNLVMPNQRIGKAAIEDIYYSVPYRLTAKLFHYIFLIGTVTFLLVFISNIPTDFNLLVENGEIYTNFSISLITQKSILYIRDLLTGGLGKSLRNISVLRIIQTSFFKSMKLILSTLCLSVVIGMVKGILDGYRDKEKGSLRALGTIGALSVPDVLVVMIVQILMVWMHKQQILEPIMVTETMRKFVIPLICLSVVPSVYISRITAVALQEEMKKDYVKAAKARGLSRNKILISHLLIGAVMKVIDSLVSVIPILLSNLILVEYVFHYPGVIYMLLKAYQEQDATTFIGLAFALGGMYVLFSLAFKVIAYGINPLKREGAY
ncbi:ABC-type dipeptide/oligopeptide/nickel transport system, permease component [Geosporobacter subterraneus DSM 17957]|uniref:ABC-type dipeptide/oligopeptide/nickel transport system, permease component n=1 Tax=Geosporobacter subterraneus DSM 17957 TaxID=1121919 RepID=A0A1M6J488_9FIRM|nr:M28 family peptidase [Geosporobacter subterraneus]SHJ41508.1 ABC-type dipeptide/oligopeptide/nickel transport system, permease component [Geosporobacter subterraneus DSM 17957]